MNIMEPRLNTFQDKKKTKTSRSRDFLIAIHRPTVTGVSTWWSSSSWKTQKRETFSQERKKDTREIHWGSVTHKHFCTCHLNLQFKTSRMKSRGVKKIKIVRPWLTGHCCFHCEQTSAMLPVPCSVKRKREGEIFYLKKRKKNGRECWTEPNKEMKGLSLSCWPPHRYGELLPDSFLLLALICCRPRSSC
jgi:hypothetical protein